MEVRSLNFIETTWSELDFNNGDLVEISDESSWEFTEKGEWLKLCQTVDNATHSTRGIFFVNNEPIILFIKSKRSSNLHRIFNQAWCMARPRLLFLETQSELLLFDLATPPSKNDDELSDKALAVIKNLLEIKTKLSNYRREQVESGKTFEDPKFSNTDYRADRALIRDLKIVREKLFDSGLSNGKLKYAHSLIGKSIFIRYLEDRGILSKEYFLNVAGLNKKWVQIIEGRNSNTYVDSSMEKLLYPKVLTNKKFTYALFEQIAKDFNGDIFPTDHLEENQVTEEQLLILSKFLDGNALDQATLFFWAYRFDIIPIELISNIYEEFYHFKSKEHLSEGTKKSSDNKGTYYTPATLVEFVLRRTLTTDILELKPTVLDPACGSGIFLVETFRRIVRYELFSRRKKKLTYSELLTILRNQIRGIELNEEAIKITAFSLYLAFLDYQSPPDILLQIAKGKRLPHLIYSDSKNKTDEYFDILLQSNAFDVTNSRSKDVEMKFSSGSADVVVGNPPWGSPPKDDEEGRKVLEAAMDWCKKKNRPISDKERSQAFIWLAIDLLKQGGAAGMLVSSGVLLKQSDKSNAFKNQWINQITLREVVNFVHVRDIFFNGAISPFLSVIFQKTDNNRNFYIDYWTARRTKIIENTKSVMLDKTDFKFLSYDEAENSDIWKLFYFGNHRDLSLISKLRLHPKLRFFEFIPNGEKPRRQGFIEGNKKLPAGWLRDYKELPATCFDNRYSPIPFSRVLRDVPNKVKERGAQYIFSGLRLLVGKVSQKTIPKGQLIVRLENKSFSFRNTINCIKLDNQYKDHYKVILGILWSSLSRYYFFMTSSKWGVWHDQVYTDEILNLPISLSEDNQLIDKITLTVDQLRDGEFIDSTIPGQQQSLFTPSQPQKIYKKTRLQLERELDKHIFRLYMLTAAEIDLINERCALDIDFFYNDAKSIAVSKFENFQSYAGDINSITSKRALQKQLEPYLKTFLDLWNLELELGSAKTLSFRVINPQNSPLIAIVFEINELSSKSSYNPIINEMKEWENILAKLDKELTTKISNKIYIEGIARVYTDKQVIIIKRNEQRLWTRTSAREDVDAVVLQLMLKQEKQHA